MKKLKTIFSPRKIVVWLLLIVTAITLPEVNKPALSETDAIVTLLSVDKLDDKFKAVVNVLTPSQEKKAKYDIYSATGLTLGEAVDQLSVAIGKDMGFSQCEIMALGDNVCSEGVMQVLDYMTRTKKVGRNTILVNFTGDILEFNTVVKNVAEKKSLKLENVINFDARYLLAEDSNIDRFVIGYYAKNSTSLMPHIAIIDEQIDNAIEVPQGESGQTNKKQYAINNGSMSVFKHGVKLLEVEPENVKKINYFANNSQRGTLKVEGVTDEIYKNATVVVSITNKDIKVKPQFKEGLPLYTAELSLTVVVEEDKELFPEKSSLVIGQKYLNETLVDKIKEQVSLEMQEICEYCKEHKVDLINVYKYFYALKNKEFEEYLQTTTMENYLDNVQFDFSVKVDADY